MKKILLNAIVYVLVVAGFTAPAWAFGSRSHHGASQGANQGSSTSNIGNGSNFSGNNFNDNDSGPGNTSGNSDQGSGSNEPSHKNFPVAPIPEPMTLSLLGTGLAALALKRKPRQ